MGFVCPKYNDVFQPSMNKTSDARLPQFELTYTSSFLRHNGVEKVADDFYNYALSYLECARAMMQKYRQKTIGIKPIYAFSPVFPVIYNCRHAVELMIKAVCQQQNHSYKHEHSLIENWHALNLDNAELEKFVILVNSIDSDGMTIRYPYDNKDQSNYNVNQTWTNIELLVCSTDAFIKELKDSILHINGI